MSKDENEHKEVSHKGESHVIQGIIQLVLVIAFIIGSLFVSHMLKASQDTEQKSDKKTRAVFADTQIVSPTPYSISFQTTGVVQARADISIVPQISGRVVSVNEHFFEGGSFDADEVLFEIEPRDFELEVQRLESVVAQARTVFNLEEAESAAAKAEWEQLNGDKPVPSLVARKPQKDEAWANLKAAKAQLENAKLDLERTKFSMPFAGRVLSTMLEQGQYVSAGQSYGSVYDLAALEVQSSLEDQQLSWLLSNENPEIVIHVTHSGTIKDYKGILKRGVSSLNSNTRFAAVRFGFVDQGDDIMPGVFVGLDIQGPRLENVTLIPVDAMQKDGSVWGLKTNNTIYPLETTTVYADEAHIVVRGLKADTRIITSKLPGAVKGMSVQTEETAEPTTSKHEQPGDE